MKHLILAAALVAPVVAYAQPAQFCVSPSLAQTLAAALQQDTAVLAMLNDAAQEPQRQAAAVAAAVAKQKADDEATSKVGTAVDAPTSTPHVPNVASSAHVTASPRP